MLCQLSANGFAVLPPTHDTLAFVDAESNIQRVETELESSSADSRLLGFGDTQDRVLLWTAGQSALRIKYQSGKEETLANLEGVVSLTRFGENGYCAYCESSEEGTIVVLSGNKLKQRDVILTRRRKVKDQSEAGPSTYCWNDTMVGAALARRNHLYLVRKSRQEGADYERLVSFKSRFEITCIAASFSSTNPESGDMTICVGSSIGRIAIHRFQSSAPLTQPPVTSELHWHSSIVRTLSLVDENHLISGGEEGVLVLWRIDRGTNSTTFRPRLGASIIDSAVMRPLGGQSNGESSSAPSALILLDDGCAIQLEVPSLVLQRRIRAWIPSNSLCVAPACVANNADPNSRYLAVALDNHRRGALTFIDADLRDSTAEERVVDVAGRNAVSTAERESQWRLDTVKFSPDGVWFAALLSSGAGLREGRRHELRIFMKELEVLRVPLALPGPDSVANSSAESSRRSVLAVTKGACAVADPNARGKVVVFSLAPEGDFALERVYDVEPQLVASLALSSDESCIAVLCNNGALRVYHRATAECIYASAVSGARNAEDGPLGVGFSANSREVFAWTKSGVDAVMSNVRLNAHIESASVSVSTNQIAIFKRESEGDDGLLGLYVWDGGSTEPTRVEAVEAAHDWESVQWAGDTIGWLLKRKNGSIHTRGGKHTFVPRRHAEKRLPLIKLRKDKVESRPQDGSISIAPKVDIDSRFGTSWCKDIPSHMLQRPPALEIVWPRAAPFPGRSDEETGPTLKRTPGEKEADVLQRKKRKKVRNQGGEDPIATLVVEEQPIEEHELLVKAFQSSANGKAIGLN